MTGLFNILNAVTSSILVAMLAFQLIARHDSFSTLGRRGASIAAGGALLAGAAWAHPGSPFDGWAAVIMRLGIMLIVIDWFGWWRRREKGE